MKKKILLLLMLIPSLTLAIEEIPLVTVAPNKTQITHKKYSIIKPQYSSKTISSEEIRESGANSLASILNSINGVQIIDNGRMAIDIRGFGETATKNTLVLMNGQPFINSDMAAIIPYMLSPQEMEQIEIIPNSGSVLYGDQAIGGMINIITKHPTKDSVDGTITAGNFATYRAHVGMNKYSKRYDIGYRLSGSFYTTKHYRRHNTERINNLNFDFNYKKLYLQYRKINQQLEFPDSLTMEQALKDPRQTQNYTDFNNQDHDIFALGIKHNFSSNWTAGIDTNARFMRGKGSFANEHKRAFAVRPKISGIINIKKLSFLPIIGADYNFGKINSSYNNKNIQNQGSAYLDLTSYITPSFSINLGGRYSKALYRLSKGIEKKPENEVFITSVGLTWRPQDHSSLFIRRAENYRFPKTDEINYTEDGKPLKAQTGVSYETGINHKNKFFTTSLTAYQIDLKNEIQEIPTPLTDFKVSNANLDPTRRRGIVANLDLMAIKYLRIKTNYNLVNPKFIKGKYSGKIIPFVAKNNLRISTIIKPQKNIYFLFEGIYTSSRFQVSDIENRSEKLGGFTVYNCGIIFKKDPIIFSLRGNNLTNKLYYDYAVYTNSSNFSGYYPASGINFLATLSVNIS